MSRGGMSFGRDLDVKDQLGQGGAAGIFRDWRRRREVVRIKTYFKK